MIKSISLVNFKGIENLTVNFDKKITCLSGSNGTGKSSTLQAIRYGLTGKTPTKEEILFKGKESGSVTLVFNDPDHTEIKREFFAGDKPTKVRVNGKATTAKSAQELICSLLDTNENYLDLNTSQDVFRELLKGELGKFLLGFVPEFFTPAKLFEVVEFTEAEQAELKESLPESFGLDECEALYRELYDRRASLKTLVQKTGNLIPEIIPEKPLRSTEDIEKELATILSAEAMSKTYLSALRTYEAAQASYNQRVESIRKLEEEFSSMVAETVNPAKRTEIKDKQQKLMSAKATAQGNIRTLHNNNVMFERTLVNLDTSVCPISERLVCTTDKTAAKTELMALIEQNNKAISNQQDIIAETDKALALLAEEEADLVAKESAVEKRKNLQASIERAKALLGEVPVKPDPIPSPDITRKPVLLKEKEDIFKYNEYLKNKEAYERYTSELALVDSLTKKFAPKGVVTEGVIGFYCEIFNEEIELLAKFVGYNIKFIPQKGLSLLVSPGEKKEPVLFDNLSTGEQLITIVIIQHLCNLLSGSKIMLIDNFNDLDKKNADALNELLKELSKDYILLVTAGINL